MTAPTSAAPPAGSPYASPTRQCDVVMKGGITSGIVYPPLVLELARSYRFRSIGGTSAGAIAAAVTAAAEFGRERGGFEKLAELNAWLGSGTNLLGLFQPTRETRPLLTLLLALERRSRSDPKAPGLAGLLARFWAWFPGWVRVAFDVVPGALRDALPARYWIATAIGGVAGGAIDVVLSRGLVDASHPLARTIVAIVLPVMFVGCYLGSLAACAWRLWQLVSAAVPKQEFGICTGLTPDAAAPTPALTDWLHARIQDLAGLPAGAPPLTVGDLRARRIEGSDEDLSIELRMVSTAISLGRSMVLPVEDETFLFREDEMRRLFPAPVVAHLLARAPRPDPESPLPAGYHTLPAPADLPVLLLARMSLSFPVLLSAVPLHVVPQEGGAPRRVWFSDGGLTSNFPIHFFDAWLPSRPTFGVNLTSESPAGRPARAGEVLLPAAERPVEPAFGEIGTVPQFLAAIWATTQNFHDNSLASLPGYRERIVQIPLAGDEGGLNLAMGPAAVHHIMDKGSAGGDLLLGFDFDRHRWVRFLSFMAQFERRVTKMGDTFRNADYDRLLESGVTPDYPYYRDAAWRTEALARIALLEEYVASVEARERDRAQGAGGGGATPFFDLDPPKPEGVLRMTPRE